MSPKNLGTAIKLETYIKFEYKKDNDLDKELVDEIEYGKSIGVENRLAGRDNDVYIYTQ